MTDLDPRAAVLQDHIDTIVDALWQRIVSTEAHLLGLHVPSRPLDPTERETAQTHAQAARIALVAVLRSAHRDTEADFIAEEIQRPGADA